VSAATAPRRRRVSTRAVLWALAVGVLIVLALDTTTRSDEAPRITEGGQVAFNPQRYGVKTYPKVVAAVEKKAAPLVTVAKAIKADPDAAGKRYGAREGVNSPYNFAVTGEGVAGKPSDSLMPVEVKGLKGTTVSLQVGPALNGTSLRDVVGFIGFNQFVNQVDYADAGTALNNQVKAKVLKDLDRASLKGKRVRFTGAFTYLAPTVITVTPVRLEVGA
jgi:predicted lipoprotein